MIIKNIKDFLKEDAFEGMSKEDFIQNSFAKYGF